MPPELESQQAVWNGPSGARWVAHQERLDRFLAPLDEALQERANAGVGERVVDVGCGCGATTLALAERVGARGDVLGVDISAPMLARARERAEGLPWVRFEQADAEVYPFSGDRDLVYSRLGIMFFDSPERAFANLRRALKPSGRMHFVCFRALADNPWFGVPLSAARRVAPLPEIAAPPAPGPFAFAAEERLRSVLSAGGFADIQTEAADMTLTLSEEGLSDATDFAIQVGPLARLVLTLDDAQRSAVVRAVEEALALHTRGDRTVLSAAVWLVSAR